MDTNFYLVAGETIFHRDVLLSNAFFFVLSLFFLFDLAFFVFSPLTVDANGSRLVVCFLCEREWIDDEAWWTTTSSAGPF